MKYQTRQFRSLSVFLIFLIGIAFSASIVGAFSLFGSSLERLNGSIAKVQ